MPKRVETGIVTSDKTAKTRRVEIPRLVRHPRYGKYVRRKTICYVHDENNESHMGDLVEIVESRPMSRTKRGRWCGWWRRGGCSTWRPCGPPPAATRPPQRTAAGGRSHDPDANPAGRGRQHGRQGTDVLQGAGRIAEAVRAGGRHHRLQREERDRRQRLQEGGGGQGGDRPHASSPPAAATAATSASTATPP